MLNKYFLFIILTLRTSACFAQSANPWADLKAPLQGLDTQPEVIGGYSQGCLRNAHELAISNKYWEMVNIHRQRYFGHPDVIPFLQNLGEYSLSKGYGKLILGDVSQPAGGPMSYGHASHQVGLDIDIRFDHAKADERMDDRVRKDYPQDPVAKQTVTKTLDTYQLRSNLIEKRWRPSYADLMKQAALYPRTERIFVSPPIKKALCDLYKDDKGGYPPWLLKVSPAHGHDAHFHVRLSCPEGDKKCKRQGAPVYDPKDPSKVGCAGPKLEWWTDPSSKKGTYMADVIMNLKKEDLDDAKSPPPTANKLEKLPQECKDLIGNVTANQNVEKTEAVR